MPLICMEGYSNQMEIEISYLRQGKSVRMCRALVMQRFVDNVQRDMTRREQRTKAALDAAGVPKSKLLDRCPLISIVCQKARCLRALPAGQSGVTEDVQGKYE